MSDPNYQITIDCADPDSIARFWAEALHYELEQPPTPHQTWRDYWLSVGVPEAELGDGDGYDSVIDPTGSRPRIWFQQVPEAKKIKNRLHLDLLVGGGRTVPLANRKERVRDEVKRLEAIGATVRVVLDNSDQNHFAIGMSDPEGNEFDVV